MKVTLEITAGPCKGREYSFARPATFIVGRGGEGYPVDCEIPPDDPFVSRQHFLLEICPPRVFAKNLSSTNPLSVNGSPLLDTELRDGDLVEVGFTRLRVCVDPALDVRVDPCQRCGANLTVMADEPTNQYCPACEDALSGKRWPRAPPVEARCRCGKNLSGVANVDGRAAELADSVTYWCRNCVALFRKPDEAGRSICGHEVLRRLGTGGMAEVFLVYQPSTGRLLALKEIRHVGRKELADRFARESRYLRTLVHGHIIRYVESGVAGDAPYLVTEYARSGSAGDLMDRAGPSWNRDIALTVVLDALRGLEYVHSQGVIHRDIKPGNILVQPQSDGRLTGKLADFGLAKNYLSVGGSVLTRRGARVGTLLFMAPEQLMDARTVREPADTYSMGVTLYYLLTGYYPFNFPTPRELLALRQRGGDEAGDFLDRLNEFFNRRGVKPAASIVLGEDPIPIRERAAQIPETLAQVVDRSVQKDIGRRFATASAFRTELERARQEGA